MNWWAAILASGVSAGLLLAFMRLAHKLDWLDRPDARKAHVFAVPAVGGVAWAIAFLFSCAVFWQSLESLQQKVVMGVGAMAILGFVDDRRPLPSWLRFGAQILIALALAIDGSILLADFGPLLGGGVITLDSLAVIVSVVGCVGVVNAMNMIDGMDGLAGSVAVCVLAVLALLCFQAGLLGWLLILLIGIVALLPFLALNLRWFGRQQARVFLGDAGSMALGLLIACALITLSQSQTRVIAPVHALWLFALPIFDTLSLMLRRAAQGRSPFSADQQHLHHLLQRMGFNVTQSLLIIVGAMLTGAIIVLFALKFAWPDVWLFAIFVCLGLAYHFAICRQLVSLRLSFGHSIQIDRPT
jgi:UDP-GlcNAc:undecaprenyl-phosphate/decaprenyl-phosphate GlcNAc-1-phosphate transferase